MILDRNFVCVINRADFTLPTSLLMPMTTVAIINPHELAEWSVQCLPHPNDVTPNIFLK
jgi:hypothetical protein